jgi:hypothetical protein
MADVVALSGMPATAGRRSRGRSAGNRDGFDDSTVNRTAEAATEARSKFQGITETFVNQ